MIFKRNSQRQWIIAAGFLLQVIALKAWAFPSICSVVNTPSFRSCLNLRTSLSVCGFPPRPCAQFSYNVPQYFIEITGSNETFFKELPIAQWQLRSAKEILPIVAEEDEGTFSYHGRTINVPFTALTFNELPCGGALWDRTCFSAMSEHLGRLWKTGVGDLWQPSFLAWSVSP